MSASPRFSWTIFSPIDFFVVLRASVLCVVRSRLLFYLPAQLCAFWRSMGFAFCVFLSSLLSSCRLCAVPGCFAFCNALLAEQMTVDGRNYNCTCIFYLGDSYNNQYFSCSFFFLLSPLWHFCTPWRVYWFAHICVALAALHLICAYVVRQDNTRSAHDACIVIITICALTRLGHGSNDTIPRATLLDLGADKKFEQHSTHRHGHEGTGNKFRVHQGKNVSCFFFFISLFKFP